MQAGEWWHSIDHDEPCRVVDTETLWGQASCLVWLPRRDTAVRVLQKRLIPLKGKRPVAAVRRVTSAPWPRF
jgi:hypothetical protein